jgi:hypothetical protein
MARAAAARAREFSVAASVAAFELMLDQLH